MRKLLLTITVAAMAINSYSQVQKDTIKNDPRYQQNNAQRFISSTTGNPLTIGAYGEIKYRQPIGTNGELDVHRLVMLLGYRFSDKVQFFSEIEFEHANVIEVEQAFINYNLANNFNPVSYTHLRAHETDSYLVCR